MTGGSSNKLMPNIQYISRPTAMKMTGLDRSSLVILLERGVIEAYKREDNAWMINKASVESYVATYGKGHEYDPRSMKKPVAKAVSSWNIPDYMLLKSDMSKVKLCAKNNAYGYVIGGFTYTITASMERFYVYTLYEGSRMSFIGEIRYLCGGRELTPMVIDEAIERFTKDHPKTPIESYSYNDIPLYADDENGLELPIPGQCCTISKEQEKEVMDIFIKYPYSQVMPQIRSWFKSFLYRYSISFKGQTPEEIADNLTSSFFQQRGIRIGSIPTDKKAVAEKKKQEEKAMAKANATIWLAFIGIELLGGLFLWGGNALMDNDHFWVGGLGLLLGFLLIALPFNILRGDFKK